MKMPLITAYPQPQGIAVSHAQGGSPRPKSGICQLTYDRNGAGLEANYNGLDEFVEKYWALNDPGLIASHASKHFKTRISTKQIWNVWGVIRRRLDRNQNESP